MAKAFKKDRELSPTLGVLPLATRRPEQLHYAVAWCQDEGPKLFCVPLESGEEALPVFSSMVATQNFISSYAFQPEWYAAGFSAGELISLLVGPCAHIDWILFDPFPGCLADGGGPANLMHWQALVDHILG